MRQDSQANLTSPARLVLIAGVAGVLTGVAGIDGASLRERYDRKQARFLCDAAILAAEAMKDAIADSGLEVREIEDPRTGIILGTGAGASMPDAIAFGDRARERGGAKVGPYQVPLIMGSSLTANLATIFHVHGHSYSVTSACATSAHAAMIGLDLIRSGRQDRVFVGGAEDVNWFSSSAFDGMGALSTARNDAPQRASRPLDRGRDGFVFGLRRAHRGPALGHQPHDCGARRTFQLDDTAGVLDREIRRVGEPFARALHGQHRPRLLLAPPRLFTSRTIRSASGAFTARTASHERSIPQWSSSAESSTTTPRCPARRRRFSSSYARARMRGEDLDRYFGAGLPLSGPVSAVASLRVPRGGGFRIQGKFEIGEGGRFGPFPLSGVG